MEQLCLPLGAFHQEDINWLSQAGHVENIPAQTVLIQAGRTFHEIYWVLDGLFTTVVAGSDGIEQEIAQLRAGAEIGFLSFINARPSVTSTIAIAPSRVLVVSHTKLVSKLRQDSAFAARFYQTVSAFLSNQLRGISTLLVRSQTTAEQLLRKVFLVFSEIYDRDLDWMVEVGVPRKLISGTCLIQEGQSLDAVYILLEGTLAVSVTAQVDSVPVSKEIARLATGEILGEMSFVDAQAASATVSAVENCLVLALPRLQLGRKLQQDNHFAARFYRAIAAVLADRLQDRLTRHVYGKLIYDINQPMEEELEYEDEIDIATLEQVSLAGVKFDWFLRRVRESFKG